MWQISYAHVPSNVSKSKTKPRLSLIWTETTSKLWSMVRGVFHVIIAPTKKVWKSSPTKICVKAPLIN